MPPTISRFEESRNRLPDAPPATDIAPERFGRDAAELAQFGGQLGKIGSALLEKRRQAIESDAAASAQTAVMLGASKIDDEERAAYQKQLADNPGQAVGMAGTADRARERINALIDEHSKTMPTDNARRAFLERIQPVAARYYLGTQDWENKTRANAVISNIDSRASMVSNDIMQSPSLAKTLDHIQALNEDVDSKVGNVLDLESATKVKKLVGRQYAASFFEGLASGTEADAAMGRGLLKSLPKELAEHLDAGDVAKLENRFDQADRERRIQSNIDIQAQKENLKIQQDKAQNAILSDIYDGKANVKDIIHGKGALLDPDKKEQMIRILEARQKEPKVENQENLRSVVERIYADPEDPMRIGSEDQIMNLYIKGKLSWDQKQKALNEFRGKYSGAGQIESEQKKNLYRQAGAALLQKDIMGHPTGQEEMAKFWSYALSEIEQAKKDGKPVRELLDANSPKYLGRMIPNYQKSPQKQMQDAAARIKNQAIRQQAPVDVPKPKGTVLMLDPSGKRFYIPEANAGKARARGFKDASGRKPQSVDSPEFDNVGDAEIALEELDVERGKIDNPSPEQEAMFQKRQDEILGYIDSHDEQEAQGDEDDLMNSARGSTAEEEAALRDQLNAVQRQNRDATRDKGGK